MEQGGGAVSRARVWGWKSDAVCLMDPTRSGKRSSDPAVVNTIGSHQGKHKAGAEVLVGRNGEE